MFAQSRSVSAKVASSLGRRSIATVSELSPKVKLASVQNGSSTASLTLVLKAGSRYESAVGAANVLKNFQFKSNKSSSALSIVRGTEQLGGVLSTTLTREHLFLTAEFLKGDEDFFLKMLSTTLFPKLQLHELNESAVPISAQEAVQVASSPSTLAVEYAHRRLFRSGLGNSLYVSNAEPVVLADVKALFNGAVQDEIALIGTGIEHETLKKLAEPYFGEELSIALQEQAAANKAGALPAVKTETFNGGEERVAIDLHTLPEAKPSLVVAYGSAGAPSAEGLVIPHLLGSGSALKWSSGSAPLLEAASAVEGSTAQAFVQSYTDASVLAIVVEAEGSKRLTEVGKKVAEIVKQVSEGKVDKKTLDGAIARAKFELASKAETTVGAVELVAAEVFTGKVATLEQQFKALDAVTPASVAKAFKGFTKNKPAVVSVARLSQMAFADELGF
ncbi:Ubiquinol cytochrome c reductase, subunit QCR2 [Phaffia rhodozyma]|uniref:Cytochrome b-c1 complex subunit 2, mitochondrial n=1 Tax=Phaffia rhodozyma TaxID=264483 RepID=A0A0F7SJD9_PHARH|nr:Ubiquinol cytochrome c reductase, subunit QCR2 [Phaffia rhodozyma]